MNDMETVWAIFSGEYSDWAVHGFCETEEEAKQVCAEMNDRVCCSAYYYEQIEKVSGCIENGVYEYCYSFYVKISGKSYLFERMTQRDLPLTYHKMHRVAEVELPRRGEYSNICGYVYVWRPGDDEMERAMKIAQDTWYQYLAEKNLI